jgi:hypothetical protein
MIIRTLGVPLRPATHKVTPHNHGTENLNTHTAVIGNEQPLKKEPLPLHFQIPCTQPCLHIACAATGGAELLLIASTLRVVQPLEKLPYTCLC